MNWNISPSLLLSVIVKTLNDRKAWDPKMLHFDKNIALSLTESFPNFSIHEKLLYVKVSYT